MNIYAIICTRSTEFSNTLKNLLEFYKKCNINVKLMVGQASIFDAYTKAVERINPSDNDIVIMCHDDIIINLTQEKFMSAILTTKLDGIGFVGPAGTARLPKHAVWWQSEKEYLSGAVNHVSKQGGVFPSYYGMLKEVEVLDGLFLAANGKILKSISLSKPEFFTGDWDFYDIYYTYTATQMGFINRTVNLNITHESLGELVGRESWHKNREAFIKEFELG